MPGTEPLLRKVMESGKVVVALAESRADLAKELDHPELTTRFFIRSSSVRHSSCCVKRLSESY